MKDEVIRARISKERFDALEKEKEESGYRSLSELLRYKLEQEVSFKPVDLTMALNEVIATRTEVKAIGRNLNQVARHLNRFEEVEVQDLLETYTVLNQSVFELKCSIEDVLNALNQTRR